MNLVNCKPTKDELSRRSSIVDLETAMRGMDENLGEDPFPLIHHFVDGCYAREMFLPKDSAIVGKIHKHEHFIIFLSGDVTVSSEKGSERINKSGISISPIGAKRAIYAHEDSVIVTIHVTKETDLVKIEGEIIAKSFNDIQIDADRKDHILLLSEFGVSERLSREISENKGDQIDTDNDLIEIKESSREGMGVFAKISILEGDSIGVARINGLRTRLGRYANHSVKPNAAMIFKEDVEVMAIKNINSGDEVTVDYRKNLKETLKCLG